MVLEDSILISIPLQEINNDKISISDDGFHGSSTISNDVNSSTSNGRQRKLETANEDKGKTNYDACYLHFSFLLRMSYKTLPSK